jgi:hypothetical protein
MNLWAQGLWADGLWAPGLWEDDMDLPPSESEPFSNITIRANSGIYSFDLSVFFDLGISYSISALDTGFTFDPVHGVLTVDSATASVATHGPITVTATNINGSTDGTPFTVELRTLAAPSGSYGGGRIGMGLPGVEL